MLVIGSDVQAIADSSTDDYPPSRRFQRRRAWMSKPPPDRISSKYDRIQRNGGHLDADHDSDGIQGRDPEFDSLERRRRIELRDAVWSRRTRATNAPEIASATYDPATGVTTIAGSFTRVATPGGWTTTLDFAASTFPESGGSGIDGTPLYVNVMMIKDEGLGRFSFTGDSEAGRPPRKAESRHRDPFIYEGFKGPPQGDIFGQGFVYGTTSEVSKAIPVVTLGCPAICRKSLLSSSTEFVGTLS